MGRAALLAIAIVLAAPRAWADDTFEPGAEQPGAVAAGASAITDAVKLGKQPAAKWKALFAFQDIATKWPAALHDCYLALAYLRVDQPREARLVLDRAATRGGERPKWCTGDLEQQLGKALAGYTQLVIDVVPRDALITIDTTLKVRSLPSVWLACPSGCKDKQVQIAAEAPGLESWHQSVALGAPLTRVEIRLEPKHEVPVAQPDAGVAVAPPSDAGVTTAPPVDAPPATTVVDRGGHHYVPVKSLSLALGITTGVIAGVSAYLTTYFRDKANDLYRSDPSFDDNKRAFETAEISAIACGGVSALSFAVYVVFAIRGDPGRPNVSVVPTQSGGVVQVGGSW